MKYSFLLPAYKSEFLEETLRSISNQTYGDFSVIVSDDCSPDDLKSIVEKFEDSRISYRRNEVNIGAEHLARHWNMLLDMTDADYVILSSDDDVYAPEFLSGIDKLVAEFPDVNVFRPKIAYIDGSGRELMNERWMFDGVLSQEEYAMNAAKEIIRSGLQQHVFNRAALKSAGGMADYPCAWFGDDATVLKMSENGIAFLPVVLFHMRLSDVSISGGNRTTALVKRKIAAAAMYYRDFMRYEFGGDIDRYNRFRIRKLTYLHIRQLDAAGFVKCIFLCHHTDKDLFPVSWLIKKTIRYFGWKIKKQ